MNKFAWLIILLAIVWAAVSWQWYTCGIKGFCDDAPVAVVDQTPEPGTFEFANDEPTPEPELVVAEAAAPACTAYLNDFIKFGQDNDPVEVQKLKRFLGEYEGADLPDLSGTYDVATVAAVKNFQNKYRDDVLVGPWGIATATGFVYKTTRAKINELYCAANAAS